MVKCGECKFWETVGDPEELLNECRLYPPFSGKFPVTKASQGCSKGELKSKEESNMPCKGGKKKGKGK